MSAPLNADLHCHSTRSDGTLDPQQLAARAHANGVELWALTDHDEISGLRAAGDAAAALGLGFVTGVEISVSVADQTVHLVGLGIDASNPPLIAGLAQVRGGRDARAQAMAAQLQDHTGQTGWYEAALRYCGNPALLGRTHFARALVERRVCASTAEVFGRFLTPGKPGYVEHVWATLEQAVGWICGAGGVAVIAHPARYRFSAKQEARLFDDFLALGGRAVEVITGSHTSADARRYAELARRLGLHASRGSDFHSPQESRCDLGRLPPLPDDLPPVWQLLH